MYRPLQAQLVAALFALVSNPVAAGIGVHPLRPLSKWLDEVTFIGLGTVSQVTVSPTTAHVSFVVTAIDGWKGRAPESVTFRDAPPGYLISEGQRVVFLAYAPHITNLKQPVYVEPMPVVRINGIDCFTLKAFRVVVPESTIAVPFEAPANTLYQPIVSLTALRAAVRLAVAQAAP